jgi:hypothetical protein
MESALLAGDAWPNPGVSSAALLIGSICAVYPSVPELNVAFCPCRTPLLSSSSGMPPLHNLRRGPRKSAPFQRARTETERDARTQHLAHLGALPVGVADGGGGAGHDARGLRLVVVAVQPRVDEHAVVAVGQGARQSNPCLHGEDRDS